MADAQWSLLFKLEADSAEVRRALDDIDRRLTGFEGNVNRSSQNVGANLRQMGRGVGQVSTGVDKLATRAALLATGGLALAAKSAIDFEQAFSGVRKTVDASPAGLENFRGQLRGLTAEIPILHGELTSIAEQGGALGVGFDAKTGQTNLDTLLEFTRVSALLGETTDVSSDQAATSLGVLSNVLGLVDKDYMRFGSTLVDLGNKGASTESQILGMAERAGAGAKLIDMSAAATLGWSSALANVGMEVEAGGTALQTFFIRSLEMISEGGEELDVYARTAGMARDEFAELFGRDSSAALQSFISGLGELEEAERLAVLEALGFNDVRITRALLGLSGDVDNLADSLRIADEAWERNSALGEEAAKKFATTRSQLMFLRNAAMDAAITVGDELLPIIAELAGEARDWLIAHPGEIRAFAEGLASGVRGLVDEVRKADLTPLLETMKTAAAVARAGFDAFNALPSGVKGLVLAIVGVNKISGGALTDLASGLSNVLSGALKLTLGRMFERGLTPMTPMFVKEVGLGGGKGGPGGGGKGGFGWGNALKLGGGVVGTALMLTSSEAQTPAKDQQSEVTRLWQEGILTDQQYQTLFKLAYEGVDVSDRLSELTGNRGYGGGRTFGGSFDTPRDSGFGWETRFGERLDKLATNEVIEHLARTNEMGLEGLGTSFQVGLANGLDPLGDTATQILARAEDPLAPPVMAEIQGHLLGLEEIQAQYLANGDVHLAAKVQTNIDTLHTLIGTADAHRAVTQRLADDAASSDAAMLATAQRTQSEITAKGNAQLTRQAEALAAVRAVDSDIRAMHDTLARKNFSPLISVSLAASIYANTAGAGITGAQLRGTTPLILHQGTWDVPGTGLAMLHEGEMVVPEFDAEAFRRMVGNGGEDGDEGDGRHVHLHTSGQPPDTSTEDGLRRAVDRAAWFMDRR